jgi:hypothetical protein
MTFSPLHIFKWSIKTPCLVFLHNSSPSVFPYGLYWFNTCLRTACSWITCEHQDLHSTSIWDLKCHHGYIRHSTFNIRLYTSEQWLLKKWLAKDMWWCVYTICWTTTPALIKYIQAWKLLHWNKTSGGCHPTWPKTNCPCSQSSSM